MLTAGWTAEEKALDEAAAHGYIRIMDESGEDYAFTASRFHMIRLPLAIGKALLSASQR